MAKAIAAYAHDGQVDKAGKPYILHPIAVSERVTTEDEKVVALLHDVLEDTFVTESTIRNLFSDVITDAIVALTRKPEETYEDFIVRASLNSLSRTVKIADLSHNMDLSRMETITQKDLDRIQKYEKAMTYLVMSMSDQQRVSLATKEGKHFAGYVDVFESRFDNEDDDYCAGQGSICFYPDDGDPMLLYEENIQSIEIVK